MTSRAETNNGGLRKRQNCCRIRGVIRCGDGDRPDLRGRQSVLLTRVDGLASEDTEFHAGHSIAEDNLQLRGAASMCEVVPSGGAVDRHASAPLAVAEGGADVDGGGLTAAVA